MHSAGIRAVLVFLLGIVAPVCAQEPASAKKLKLDHDASVRFLTPRGFGDCTKSAQEVLQESAKECGDASPTLLRIRPGHLPENDSSKWTPRSLLDIKPTQDPLTRALMRSSTFNRDVPQEVDVDYASLLRLYRVGLACPEGTKFSVTLQALFTQSNPSLVVAQSGASLERANLSPRLTQMRVYYAALRNAATDPAVQVALAQELENVRSDVIYASGACPNRLRIDSESQLLTGLIEAFHKKLDGKPIRQISDLYAQAGESEKALLDLLFSVKFAGALDFAIGPERANYYRGILINGPIKTTASGANLDPKSREYLLKSNYLGRGVPENVPQVLQRYLDFPGFAPNLNEELHKAFASPYRDPAAERGYLQEVLMRLEKMGIKSGDIWEKIRAEKLRSYLHDYLAEVDRRTGNIPLARLLPEKAAAVLSEGGKHNSPDVDADSLRTGIGHDFALGVSQEELNALYGIRALPVEKRGLGMASMNITSEQFADIERRMAAAAQNARHQLDAARAGRSASAFYGRALAEEREVLSPGVWSQGPVDRIVNALGRKGLGLSPEERLRLKRGLRSLSLDLLADLFVFAQEGGPKGKLQDRERYSPSFEDLARIVFSPEGQDDLIQAYALMSWSGAGVTNGYLMDRLTREPVLDRLKMPSGKTLRKGPGLTPAERADLAHQAEDLLIANSVSADQRDALALFSRVMRESRHDPETLYREMVPKEAAHALSSSKYVHDIVSRRHVRQQSEALAEIGKNTVAASDRVAAYLTANGYGMPIVAQSALEQFFQKSGLSGIQMVKQLQAGMKPEAFGKLMGGLDPTDVEEQIFGALREHLPYAYYLMVNGEHQASELKQQALQELLKDGKLSQETHSFLGVLALNEEICREIRDEAKLTRCLERTLHEQAAELLMAKNQGALAEKLMTAVYPDAKERSDHMDRVRERAKSRSDTRALGDALGVSLEQTLALGRGAIDQQTAAERARQELASQWNQQTRENLERSLSGASTRDKEIITSEQDYRSLMARLAPLEKNRREKYHRLDDGQYREAIRLQRELEAGEAKMRPFMVHSKGGSARYTGSPELKTQVDTTREKLRPLLEQAELDPKAWEALKALRTEASALKKKLPTPKFSRSGPVYPPEHAKDGQRLQQLIAQERSILKGRKLPGREIPEAEAKALKKLEDDIASNRAHRLALTNANRDGALALLSLIQDRLDPLRTPRDGEEITPQQRLVRMLGLLGTVRDENSELRKRFHGKDLERLEGLLQEYEALYMSFGDSGQLMDAEGKPVDEARLRDFNARLKSALTEHGDQLYGDREMARTAAKLAPFLKGIGGAKVDPLLDLPNRVKGLIELCAKEPCGLNAAELEYLRNVQQLHLAAKPGEADRLDRRSNHEGAEEEDRVESDSYLELQTLREQLLATARDYDQGSNGYHTQVAFENLIDQKVGDFNPETKLKLLEQQKALNQDLLKGRSLADVIARSARSAPPAENAGPEALEHWLQESGFGPMVQNWKFELTSGGKDYKAPPKELDRLFGKMLREARQQAESRTARKAEIESVLREIVPPTGKRLAGTGLWDWDRAKLYLIADSGKAPTGKQKITQEAFRNLLNEYAELNSAEEHILNPTLQVNGKGEDEFYDYIHEAFARSRYRSGATAVNKQSVVTPLHQMGQKPEYAFGNYEQLRPEFEKRAKEMWALMANNGPLYQAIAKKGEFGQAFKQVMHNVGNNAQHLATKGLTGGPGSVVATVGKETWNREGYGLKSYELDNDRLVDALTNHLASGISELSQLGDSEITVEGVETPAADEASRLRKAYSDVLKEDAHSNEARLGNIEVMDEGTKLAIVTAATWYIPGGSVALAGKLSKAARMLKMTKTAAALRRYNLVGQALSKGWELKNGWALQKAYGMASGSVNMVKTGVKSSAIATGFGATLKSYDFYRSGDEGDAVDSMDANCKPGKNGIPDWRDAMKCGISYRFPKGVADAVDSDGNGIPDWYDWREFGASSERYLIGSVREQWDGVKSQAAMMAAIPLASAMAGKFFLRPISNLISGEKRLAVGAGVANASNKLTAVQSVRNAAPLYLKSFEGQVGTVGLKLAQGESLENALWGSAFMTPVDDWAVLWALKRNNKLSQSAIWGIKKLFNHGIDATQGISEVLTKGAYRTQTGVETKNWLTAALYSMGESYYMSDKASKPAQAQMDFVPRMIVDDLRRESREGKTGLRSELLDYEIEFGRDRDGRPQTRRVRDLITETANMEDFKSPQDYEAFVAIFSEKLEARGVPPEQIAKAYTRAIQKSSKLELNFGEVSGLIKKMVREERLRKVASGEQPASELIGASRFPGSLYRAYQYLSAGDAMKDTGKSIKKNGTRELVNATASDFGLNSSEFASYIKMRYQADPTVTSALTLRTLAEDMIREKKKKKS